MKICIVVLDSLTGNTVITAELIKRGISEYFHGDAEIDVLNVRTKDTNFNADLIAKAELLGFGTPTICYKPTPNVLKWIKDTLPQECIARKSFFTFTTYGTHPGACAYALAEALLQRGCACQHIGLYEAFTPDTYMWFLPHKGEPQMRWSASSVRSCKAFGARIAEVYSSGEPPAQFKPSFIARVLGALPGSAVKTMLGDVAVDPALCVGCGACARACPTGALRMGKDEKTPVWDSDKCISCVHCVATCKRGALRVPTSDSRLFYDACGVDPDNIDTVEDSSGQTAKMILRHVSTGTLRRPVASLKGILMFAWALFLMLVSWIRGGTR